MSGSNCCFLTCIQVSQEKDKVVWNFPHFVSDSHSQRLLTVVNEAEAYVFLEFSCLMDVGNLISGSSAFSKSSLNIWKFSIHILLKSSLENVEHYCVSVWNMWNEYNCGLVWIFFGIAFLWDWNENWGFPVLWPLLGFPNLLAFWVEHFYSIIP